MSYHYLFKKYCTGYFLRINHSMLCNIVLRIQFFILINIVILEEIGVNFTLFTKKLYQFFIIIGMDIFISKQQKLNKF